MWEIWQDPKNRAENGEDFFLFCEEDSEGEFTRVINYLTASEIGQLLGGN